MLVSTKPGHTVLTVTLVQALDVTCPRVCFTPIGSPNVLGLIAVNNGFTGHSLGGYPGLRIVVGQQ